MRPLNSYPQFSSSHTMFSFFFLFVPFSNIFISCSRAHASCSRTLLSYYALAPGFLVLVILHLYRTLSTSLLILNKCSPRKGKPLAHAVIRTLVARFPIKSANHCSTRTHVFPFFFFSYFLTLLAGGLSG